MSRERVFNLIIGDFMARVDAKYSWLRLEQRREMKRMLYETLCDANDRGEIIPIIKEPPEPVKRDKRRMREPVRS